MTPSFWLALAFYLVAAAWTWWWVRPRMNRMLALTEKAIASSERASIHFQDLIRETKRVLPPERVEKLLGSVEKLAQPLGHFVPLPPASVVAPPLPDPVDDLGEPPAFGE